MNPRRLAALLAATALVAACHSGPPQPDEYRVLGDVVVSHELRFEVRDAYVWRQPVGDAATILLSDRALPKLPADDAWPVVDLALLIAWARTRV